MNSVESRHSINVLRDVNYVCLVTVTNESNDKV